MATIAPGLGDAALTVARALPLGILSTRCGLAERSQQVLSAAPGSRKAYQESSSVLRWFRPLRGLCRGFIRALSCWLSRMPSCSFLYALVGALAALGHAQARLEEVGRSLAVGWFGVLARIILPLATPGLGAAAALVFIGLTTELSATLS